MTQRTIKHLWECAMLLNGEKMPERLLKSYYVDNVRQLDKTQNFSISQMCPYCSIHWGQNSYKLKLHPQGLASSSKARKLITKMEESKKAHSNVTLTKKQRTRAKWLQKRMASRMEITCDFCQGKSFIKLDKPKKATQDKDDGQQASSGVVIAKKPTKKKKNKDKTAGLKIPAKKTATIPNSETPKRDDSKKQKQPTPLTNQSKQEQRPPNKNNKKEATKSKPPQVVLSKTQQQNSLLQLAALLKTQQASSKAQATSTQKNRVDALLK